MQSPRYLVIPFSFFTVAACQSGNSAAPQDATMEGDSCGTAAAVDLETFDGITLKADYTPPSTEGKGAIVLLHMIPPNFDRTSYPARIRTALADSGHAVLNIDRRGAGESEGNAQDAYQGSLGRLDVEAGVSFLIDSKRACATAPDKILLVGASNGTTSVMDYTTNRSNTELPTPAAIAWLSPGGYTESQNTIQSHQQTLAAIPVLIVHPDNEPWAVQHENFSTNWEIVSLENGKAWNRELR